MQSSRLWALFLLGSAAATAALIVLLDLTPSSRRRISKPGGRTRGVGVEAGAGLIVHATGGDPEAGGALREALKRTKADRIFVVAEIRTNLAAELDAALKRDGVDPRRVFLMARSVRLAEVWTSMAETNVFAAAQCWVRAGTEPGSPEECVLPRYLGLVAEDAAAAPAARKTAALALKKGCHVVYRELESGAGAELRRERRENDVLDDAVVWFTTLRNERVTVPREAMERLGRTAAERWARLTRGDFDEMARIGGPAPGRLILKALGSRSDKYRIAASARCKGTWFGEEVLRKLDALLEDPNEMVRLQVIDSLALLARWHNVRAQETLCRAALDPGMSDKDREAVVRALAEATRLDVPLGIAVPVPGGDGEAYLNRGGAWALHTFLGLLGSERPVVRRAAEGAIWMWKVPDDAAGQWRKRFPDRLYESLTGSGDERRDAIVALKKWAADAYPAP